MEQIKQLEKIGIFHRDIKPGNILITENWEFKLIDFGLSQLLFKGDKPKGKYSVCGTHEFMHPILLDAWNRRDSKVECNLLDCDIFSLNQIAKIYGMESITVQDLENFNTITLSR